MSSNNIDEREGIRILVGCPQKRFYLVPMRNFGHYNFRGNMITLKGRLQVAAQKGSDLAVGPGAGVPIHIMGIRFVAHGQCIDIDAISAGIRTSIVR